MSQCTGSCLCGAITYQVSQIEHKMANCHCSMCRKFHGAAFATYGEAKRENFRWLNGEDLLKQYTAENGTTRRFCGHCGSSMTFSASNDSGKFVEFALATLDTPITVRPDAHIYVDYKADWHAIVDELPQYREGRDSELVKST